MMRRFVLGLGLLVDLVGVIMLWYVAPRIIHDDSGIYAPDISYTYFLVAVIVLVIAFILLVVGIVYPDFSKAGPGEESTGKEDQSDC